MDTVWDMGNALDTAWNVVFNKFSRAVKVLNVGAARNFNAKVTS